MYVVYWTFMGAGLSFVLDTSPYEDGYDSVWMVPGTVSVDD